MAFVVPALAVPLENAGVAVSTPFKHSYLPFLGVGQLTGELEQPSRNSTSAEPDCDDEEGDSEESDSDEIDEADQDNEE